MRRFATAVAALVLTLAACTSSETANDRGPTLSAGNSTSSATVVPPTQGRIVFADVVPVPGAFRIWTIATDGSGRLQVTTPPATADDLHPRFSPDGTRIAFVREDKRAGDRIVVVNADGTGLRVFNPPCTGSCSKQCALASLPCPGDDHPDWSTDGTSIAFERAYGPNLRRLTVAIWVANADGTHPRQLTHLLPEVSEDHSPSFSPNGRRLVFMRDVHRSRNLDRTSLWTIGVDGKGLRLLYRFPLDRPGGGFNARWSPDGSRIVFSDYCGFGSSCRAVPEFVPQIFSIRPDGTDIQQLTHGSDGGIFPAWSPDGKWIVFLRSVTGSIPGCSAPPRDIYVMRTDGTGIRQITTDACFPGAPDWGV